MRTNRSGLIVATLILACSFLLSANTVTYPKGNGASILVPLATDSLLLDIDAVNSKLVAVGERGHVLVSNDDGRTWQQVQVPTRSTLTGVFLLDEKHGWAVGHDAVILRTTDGGVSWQRVFYDPGQERPLFDIWFADRQYGFAVGAYGFFLETHDGGQSWQERIIAEEDFHLNQIGTGPEEQLIIAGEAGHIYHSHDRGETWQGIESPYHGSFFAAAILAEETYVVAGLRGHLFISIDAGNNWKSLPSRSSDMLTDILEIDSGRFVVVGLDGALMVGRPSGQMEYHFQQDRKGMTAIAANSRNNLYVVGTGGIKELSLMIGGDSQ